MSNVCWPAKPWLCNKDGRDCRKYETKSFVLRNDSGDVEVRISVTGDYSLQVRGLNVERVQQTTSPTAKGL